MQSKCISNYQEFRFTYYQSHLLGSKLISPIDQSDQLWSWRGRNSVANSWVIGDPRSDSQIIYLSRGRNAFRMFVLRDKSMGLASGGCRLMSRKSSTRWIQRSRRRRRRRRRRHPTAITPLCEFAICIFQKARCTGKHKQLPGSRNESAAMASSSEELHAWKIYGESTRFPFLFLLFPLFPFLSWREGRGGGWLSHFVFRHKCIRLQNVNWLNSEDYRW